MKRKSHSRAREPQINLTCGCPAARGGTEHSCPGDGQTGSNRLLPACRQYPQSLVFGVSQPRSRPASPGTRDSKGFIEWRVALWFAARGFGTASKFFHCCLPIGDTWSKLSA